MMYVTKIKMKQGCYYSSNLVEIDQLYITGCDNPGYFKKAVIHDYVKENPGSIKVDRYPYPVVIDAVSVNGEKYVRSSPNGYTHDNLLDLPREAG
jgi:hypothetical protein